MHLLRKPAQAELKPSLPCVKGGFCSEKFLQRLFQTSCERNAEQPRGRTFWPRGVKIQINKKPDGLFKKSVGEREPRGTPRARFFASFLRKGEETNVNTLHYLTFPLCDIFLSIKAFKYFFRKKQVFHYPHKNKKIAPDKKRFFYKTVDLHTVFSIQELLKTKNDWPMSILQLLFQLEAVNSNS